MERHAEGSTYRHRLDEQLGVRRERSHLPWQGAESFPRTVSLQTVDGTVQMVQAPVKPLVDLGAGPTTNIRKTEVSGTVPLPVNGEELDIQARLIAGSAPSFGLNVRAGGGQLTQIGYDTASGELYVDRSKSGDTSFNPSFAGRASAPLPLDAQKGITLRILVDASSVEIFAGDGTRVLTEQIFPDASSVGISAFANDGTPSPAGHLAPWPTNLAGHDDPRGGTALSASPLRLHTFSVHACRRPSSAEVPVRPTRGTPVRSPSTTFASAGRTATTRLLAYRGGEWPADAKPVTADIGSGNRRRLLALI